ncbi:hypothetical protein, partial [Stenotrophomonas maltophilia]|uniref:hypothetical protein n=1 Tax=Stenotrophomonas maltophilia TaxID=40324 RepID=UPI001952E4DB
ASAMGNGRIASAQASTTTYSWRVFSRYEDHQFSRDRCIATAQYINPMSDPASPSIGGCKLQHDICCRNVLSETAREL